MKDTLTQRDVHGFDRVICQGGVQSGEEKRREQDDEDEEEKQEDAADKLLPGRLFREQRMG